MPRDFIQLAVCFVILIAVEGSYWWYGLSDVFVAFYVFLSVILLFARTVGWPRARWFGAGYVKQMRDRWGERKFGNRYNSGAAIDTIEPNSSVRNFFEASIYEENTEKLCREIYHSLPVKIMGYIFAAILFMFLAKNSHHAAPDDLSEIAFKLLAAVAVSLGPLVWEYAKLEKQRYLNFEIRTPPVEEA